MAEVSQRLVPAHGGAGAGGNEKKKIPLEAPSSSSGERMKLHPLKPEEYYYSDVYSDDLYDYRHVTPSKHKNKFHLTRLLTEAEWRHIGITMSPGWEHFMIHGPERYIFVFRRPRRQSA